jgi:hypothetical protein
MHTAINDKRRDLGVEGYINKVLESVSFFLGGKKCSDRPFNIVYCVIYPFDIKRAPPSRH